MNKKLISSLLAVALMATSCKFNFEEEDKQKPKDQTLVKLVGTSGSKTWRPVAGPYEIGIGPASTLTPDFYNFPDGADIPPYADGMLQNRYTFEITGFKFKPKNTYVTAHWAYANADFGLNRAQYDDAALSDPNHKESTFKLVNEKNGIGTGYTLDIANGSYIGRYDRRHKYHIMSISDDTLRLRHLLSDSPDSTVDDLAWYSTYVAEK